MSEIEYSIVIDQDTSKKEITDKFKSGEESSEITGKISFVGFVINDNKMLISFPKNYMDDDRKNYLEKNPKKLEKEIKLLFDVIYKCSRKKSEIGIDVSRELNVGYPFEAFYNVYNYFNKYGLYANITPIHTVGFSGKVNWNKTLAKSSKIFTDSGIIFTPLIVRRNRVDYVFVTKCMCYVINYTINLFPMFIKNKKTPPCNISDINFENSDNIVKMLKKEKIKVFKDEEIKLIDNLIIFFTNKKKTSGKKIEIKLKKFELVWEDMVKKYISEHLLGVGRIGQKEGFLFFRKTKLNKCIELKNKKETFKVENYRKGNKRIGLQPDLYFFLRDSRYILDAKYYVEIKEIDYKQISYYFLLKSESESKRKNIKQTHNILLLPTHREMKDPQNFQVHFDLNTLKFNSDENKFRVLLQYLNIKQIMSLY